MKRYLSITFNAPEGFEDFGSSLCQKDLNIHPDFAILDIHGNIVTVEIPENYFDVHVDLCIEDMHIHPDFVIIDVVESVSIKRNN